MFRIKYGSSSPKKKPLRPSFSLVGTKSKRILAFGPSNNNNLEKEAI